MSLRFTTAVVVLAWSVVATGAPINLSTWTKEGNPANGNWVVAADGNSVVQTLNDDPTFFVSPNSFINTEFVGTFQVQTTGDDDYIGFVFGYQSPLASNGDAANDYSFFLFDWKQANQSDPIGVASEGFNLSYVNGVVTTFSPFWAHGSATTPDPDFQVIDTDYGATRGWADNTAYEFTLLYQSGRIRIDIEGGTGDFATKQTIFDITPSDVMGLTEFPEGRFGFYNYSQASVRYAGFTEDVVLPDPNGSVPEPATLALVGIGLLGIAGVRRRQASHRA